MVMRPCPEALSLPRHTTFVDEPEEVGIQQPQTASESSRRLDHIFCFDYVSKVEVQQFETDVRAVTGPVLGKV